MRMLLFAVLQVPLALVALVVHQFLFTGSWALGPFWHVVLGSYAAAGGPSVLFAFLMNWLDRRGAPRRTRCIAGAVAGVVAGAVLTDYVPIAAQVLRTDLTTRDFLVLGAAVGPATIVLVDWLVPKRATTPGSPSAPYC